MRYAPSNKALADWTTALMLSRTPAVAHGAALRCLACLMDPRLRAAMAVPQPPPLLQGLVRGCLLVRACAVALLAPPSLWPTVRGGWGGEGAGAGECKGGAGTAWHLGWVGWGGALGFRGSGPGPGPGWVGGVFWVLGIWLRVGGEGEGAEGAGQGGV